MRRGRGGRGWSARWPCAACATGSAFALALAALGALGCASNGTAQAAAAPGAGAQEAGAMNRLTDAERTAGWKLLFDGRSLNGWRAYARDRIPSDWVVQDGAIGTGSGDDIISVERYTDFELAVDWMVSPGANSGIFYRAARGEDHIYYSAPEYQILDDERHPDGRSQLTSAASDYGLYPVPRGVARPAGEWNSARIVVRGNHVEHWLNGTKLIEYELHSADWEQRVADSKFAAWPAYGQATTGYVGLQEHGGRVWFRNIKIRPLG